MRKRVQPEERSRMKSENGNAQRCKWMRDSRWGIFMHFLSRETAETPMTPERWNAHVDAFDVDALAAQLAEIGAGWFFLTLTQNSGWFCAPNAALDRLTGRAGDASHCSKRDLVADMAEALAPYGIRLMVYLPCHAPMSDEVASIALRGIPPWSFHLWSPLPGNRYQGHEESDPRLRTFLRNWETMIREWSQRWGKRVHGWWFDGCYHQDRLYDFPDEPNFASLASAVRSGNPDSCFCANPGVDVNPRTICVEEDYTSGENTRPEWSCCFQPLVGQAQYHILTYAGTNWCSLPLRYSPDEFHGINTNIIDGGGIVSWEVPFHYPSGKLGEETMELFRSWRDFLKQKRQPWSSRVTLRTTPVLRDGECIADGEALLEIRNPASERLTGTLTVTGNPPLALDLAPEESTQAVLRLPPDSGKLELRFGNELRVWSYASVAESVIHRVPAGGSPKFTRPFPFTADGETIGELQMALVGNRLLARGVAREGAEDTVIHIDHWRCSCLEAFVQNRSGIRQYFFLPSAGVETGKILDENRCYQPDKTTTNRCAPHAEYYEFEVSFPVDFAGDELRIEWKLSRCHGHSVQRAALFGSREFFAHSREFGRLKVEEEQQ